MPPTNAKPIMALTVIEPWATLIRIGAKRFETRSWATSYRGPLVIHAGKARDYLNLMWTDPFTTILANAGYHAASDFHLGCALCVADLVDCIQMRPRTWQAMGLSCNERAFGDFTEGRYAWKLENVRPFAEPIPWRGAQGLWQWRGPLPEGVTP